MDSQRGSARAATSLPLVVNQRVLKEELRMTIMAKRHARGESKLDVEFTEPETRQLTQAEVERKERRREQNRRAAQRCRRKKRMNQMTVLQSYDWILSRNQQLLQEVETLRQDRDNLQSTLNAHLEVCTCSHAQNNPLHMLTSKVKVEPRDDSPTMQLPNYPSPTPSSTASGSRSPASMSCQYAGTPTATDTSVVPGSCGYSHAGGVQPVSYNSQSLQPASCGVSFATSTQSHDLTRPCDQNFPMYVDTRCSPVSRPVSSAHSPLTRSPHTPVPPPPAMSSSGVGSNASPVPRQFVPSPIHTMSTQSISDELALLRMSRGCLLQEDAATPLSNDGRHSISSMCSDLSTASEHHSDVRSTPENHGDVMGNFEDDESAADVSELLSQINQHDLFFQQDDVFINDPALASIQDNIF